MNPTSSPQASLLDLPELVLEEISKHLPPNDLASCMLCCSTLHVLLRPRQNANVCARHLGRKWALRACGRALFADVGRRIAAGVEAFEGSEAVPNWDVWTAALRGIASHGPGLFSEWTRLKATYPAFLSMYFVDLSLFFYLCRLAESRGFDSVAGILARVWDQTFSVLSETRFPSLYWGTVFQQLRATEVPNLRFFPFQDFAGSQFFPGPLEAPEGVLARGIITELQTRLLRSLVDILPSEVVCVLWLLFNIRYTNDTSFKSMNQEILVKLFQGLGPMLEGIFKSLNSENDN